MIVDNKIKKQIIGGYLIDNEIDGVKLATTRKPNRIRRFLIYVVFGWKWMEMSKIKNNM